MSDESIRDSLSSAFDKASGGTSATPTPAAPAAQPTTPTPQANAQTATVTAATSAPVAATATVPVPAGTQQEGAAAAPALSEGAQEGAATAAKPASQESGAKPAVPPVKAPQSWRPDAREKWAALPPEVQQEVSRREREMAVTIQQTAQHRKVAEGFQQVVQPYAGMIQAEGGDPFKAVGSLLQTAAALRTAPPAHRAQLVANIVKTYGVPLEDLDAALAGQAPAQGQPQASQHLDPEAIARQVQERVLHSVQQQRQSAMSARAKQEADVFLGSGEAEFIDDVRNDIADILELNARRGVEVSLKDAYKRACEMHPEVSKVLKQREQAQQANAAQASTQRARTAASSVVTTPAGPPGPKDDSLRGMIETAWASTSGR
ncbi:hypothetical protein [Corallococcus silvisoli]|uniref:hypothetical protein n=1 Tax=Corallococcus silvisoli TaxID=2697031 RepID=UPI0013768EC6|nr:hypothetical protein [Corallococcus silvisoli]NBD11824.1 hypothetical protein [Corallococcus silvisoli]